MSNVIEFGKRQKPTPPKPAEPARQAEQFNPARAIAETFGISITTDDAVRLHNRLQLLLAAAHHRGAEAECEAIAKMFDGEVWAYDYREIAAKIRARGQQ